MPERAQAPEPSRRSPPQESAAESSNRAQHSGNQTQGPVLHNCRIGNFYNITGRGGPRPPAQAPAPPIPDYIRNIQVHHIPAPVWAGQTHPSMGPPPAPTIIRHIVVHSRQVQPPLAPSMWLRDPLERLRPGRYREPHLDHPIVYGGPRHHERQPVRETRSQIPRPSFATGRSRRAVYSETGSMAVSPSDSESGSSGSSNSSSSSGGGSHQSADLAAEDRRLEEAMLREAMHQRAIDACESEMRRERDEALMDGIRSRRFRDPWESGSSAEIEGMVQTCRFPRCDESATGEANTAGVNQSPTRGMASESRTAAGNDGTGQVGSPGVVVGREREPSGERCGGVRLPQEHSDDENIATFSPSLCSGSATLVQMTPAEGSETGE